MNTQRKVKTVRCNTHAHNPFEYGKYYVVETTFVTNEQDGIYTVDLKYDGRTYTVVAYEKPTLNILREFTVHEFHGEQPNRYATIEDVKRMIQEALGKSEKVEEKGVDDQKAIFHQMINDIRELEYRWSQYAKGKIKNKPPDVDSLIKDWLSQYTITRK